MKMRWQIQKGSASLFLVIFSTILAVVIITAFVRFTVQDQMQATANDLSKSALDSANAGIEDAKRAVLRYINKCPSGPTATTECQTWFSAMNGQNCQVPQTVLGIAGADVMVGDTSLNQAYTCVKVTLNTEDYVDTLYPGVSKVIHLKSDQSYDTVELSWFSLNDLAQASDSPLGIKLDSNQGLTKYGDWNLRTPSLMRAQLLQLDSNFTLSSFDDSVDPKPNTATLFLMPTRTGSDKFNFTAGYTTAPYPIKCNPGFPAAPGSTAYGCTATITLPTLPNRQDAFLRLLAPYNTQTTFRVKLLNGATPVQFDGVQPKVDSTGRANDQFRRISTRLQQKDFPYVDAAIDMTSDLCKTFTVGADSSKFDPGDCTP